MDMSAFIERAVYFQAGNVWGVVALVAIHQRFTFAITCPNQYEAVLYQSGRPLYTAVATTRRAVVGALIDEVLLTIDDELDGARAWFVTLPNKTL